MAWAEDRAPRRHAPSADPGAKTEGGAARCRPVFPSGLARKRQIRALWPNVHYLVSQPRFLHFTLNHYKWTSAPLKIRYCLVMLRRYCPKEMAAPNSEMTMAAVDF